MPADAETVLGWMKNDPQGTVVLTADLAVAARLVKRLADAAPDLCIGALPSDPRAFNAVCAYPPAQTVGPGYRRIVLAGVPEEYPLDALGAAVYRLPEWPEWLRGLPDLPQLRAAYRALMRVGQRPAWCPTPEKLIRLVADESGLEDAAALAALLAMADMGLFELTLREDAVRIRRSGQNKAAPEDSAVWRVIQRWRAGEAV